MKIHAIILTSVLAVSSQVLAGDAGAGRTVYVAKGCIGCHGPDGVSVVPMVPPYPSLKGKTEAFVKESLTDFRSGKRQNSIMNAMANGLKDVDIENLSAYIGTL